MAKGFGPVPKSAHDGPNGTMDPDAPINPIKLKALRYRTLSQLWFFPSIGASIILILSLVSSRQNNEPLLSTLTSNLEALCAIVILALHAVFYLKARQYHRLNVSQR